MKNRMWVVLGLLILLGLPCEASANTGTPLMWATAFHLALGNALIGLGEGLLLAFLFKLKKWRSIGIMIVANYFSTCIGRIVLHSVIPLLPVDLNNGWYWFWVLAAAAYLATLLLEWPFVALCFRGAPSWFKRSWVGNLTVQTVSYVVIFSWYWMASGTSLYTKMNVVPVSQMKLPQIERIYYIGDKGNEIFTCDLYGNDKRWVQSVATKDKMDRLFVRPSSAIPGKWDLMAITKGVSNQEGEVMEVIKDFAKQAAPDWRSTTTEPRQYDSTWFNFGPAALQKELPGGEWEFTSGFWAIEGLRAINQKTGKRVHFSYETIFGEWYVRNATQLPTDQAVFQLGENQICVFDPATKQVALITRGRGPVVWFGK